VPANIGIESLAAELFSENVGVRRIRTTAIGDDLAALVLWRPRLFAGRQSNMLNSFAILSISCSLKLPRLRCFNAED
jgi:hypothetical protein